MKKTKRIIASFFAAVMIMAMTITSFAAGNEAISDARSGVVAIDMIYVDQAGGKTRLGSGTAFLIDEQYAITNYHVTHLSYADKVKWTEKLGVDFVNTTVSGLKLFIVVRRDMMIEAVEVNGSEEADFSILKLSQPLKDRTYLSLGNSDDVIESESVYALGFPVIADVYTDANYYTTEDVNITNGIVNKKITENAVPYIQHSAEISSGNSGGPLLNEMGAVIGVNRMTITEETRTDNEESSTIRAMTYRAIAINEIKFYLDSLGIPYLDGDGSTPIPESVPTPSTEVTPSTQETPVVDTIPVSTVTTVDTSDLEKKIDNAKNIEADGYTKDSYENMLDVLAAAEDVLADANATQGEVDDAASELSDAVSSLEEETGLPMGLIIGIIIAVVVLILIIVIIIVAVSSSNKKKAQKRIQAQQVRPVVPNTQPPFNPAGQMPGGQSPRPTGASFVPPVSPSEGAGETSLLNSGAGETSLLSGQARVAATLVRMKTNENIAVNKQVFTIGKERRKVDYCIADNNSVSRAHVQIICRGTEYFVVDQNSTNFTFVNGNKIAARQEVKIKNGDRIKLADEEFEFRTM